MKSLTESISLRSASRQQTYEQVGSGQIQQRTRLFQSQTFSERRFLGFPKPFS